MTTLGEEVREVRLPLLSKTRSTDMSRVVVNQVGWQGVGFGSALAMAISFHVNESIGWAILHGIFSWFYVIYYAFFING
jgi:hypothetical protein